MVFSQMVDSAIIIGERHGSSRDRARRSGMGMEQLKDLRVLQAGVIPLLVGMALLVTATGESRAQEAQASLVCVQQFDANGVESWVCMKEDDETVMDVCPETEAEIGDCVQLVTQGATVIIRFDGSMISGTPGALLGAIAQMDEIIGLGRLALIEPGGTAPPSQFFQQFLGGENQSIVSTTTLGGG